MLKVGDAAPDFSLPNADMHLQSLGDYRAALLVLYFYPRDDTPGCTLQATDFTEMINQFESAGAGFRSRLRNRKPLFWSTPIGPANFFADGQGPRARFVRWLAIGILVHGYHPRQLIETKRR